MRKNLVLLVLISIVAIVLTGCDFLNSFHYCESACPDCGKCLDAKCTVPVCAEKCEGHQPTHEHSYGEWTKVDDDNHKKTCACNDEVTEAHTWAETNRVDATHTTEGKVTYTCSGCSATKEETLNKITDHSYGEWTKVDDNNHKKTCACGDEVTEAHTWAETNRVDATHTAEGKVTYTCSGCSATKEETLNKITDHSYGEWTKVDDNNHKKTCACGDEVIESHSFTNYVSNGDATCKADGTKTATCDKCTAKETVTDVGSKKEHNPAEAVKENEVNATCATNGSYDSVIYCSNEYCKEELNRETITITATGEHVYATEQDRVDATCTTEGYVIMACGCGATEKTTLAVIDHNIVIDNAVAPTCTATGLTEGSHCTTCDYKITQEIVNALGHSWSNLALATAPTYEAAGVISGTCAGCDITFVDIPAISVANGYTVLISGLVTRWQYTFEGFTFTIDLENTDAVTKTHDFVTFANDPFIVANGGSISGTIDVTNDTPRYENTRGQTFTTTITVSENTVVDFIIKVESGNENTYNNTCKGLFSSITLNGESVNINDSSVTGIGWGRSLDVIVARLELKKGTNVISFTRTTDTAEKNNYNIFGVGFKAVEGVTIALGSTELCINGHKAGECELATAPTYTKNGIYVVYCETCLYPMSTETLPVVSEANGYTPFVIGVLTRWEYTSEKLSFAVELEALDQTTIKTHNFVAFVNDPFIAENGGSISGTVSVTGGTPRYEKTQGQTFTTTITVSEDTVLDFIIKVESGTGNTYKNTCKGLFSSITLNGESVTINDSSVTGIGWGKSLDVVVARLRLTEGTNVITFTRATDKAEKNNYNIFGVGFKAVEGVTITLGSEE